MSDYGHYNVKKGKKQLCDIVTENARGSGYTKATKKTEKEDNTMSAMNINKNSFHEEVMKSEKPVLIDFWAPWCGPCRMLSPIVDEVAEEHPEIKVGKVNVDEEEELAAKFDVMSIPSLFVLKNGEVVNQSVGAIPKAQVVALIK